MHHQPVQFLRDVRFLRQERNFLLQSTRIHVDRVQLANASDQPVTHHGRERNGQSPDVRNHCLQGGQLLAQQRIEFPAFGAPVFHQSAQRVFETGQSLGLQRIIRRLPVRLEDSWPTQQFQGVGLSYSGRGVSHVVQHIEKRHQVRPVDLRHRGDRRFRQAQGGVYLPP